MRRCLHDEAWLTIVSCAGVREQPARGQPQPGQNGDLSDPGSWQLPDRRQRNDVNNQCVQCLHEQRAAGERGVCKKGLIV